MGKEKKQADDDSQVKVYLRLRPMDRLETSKRSKDCIELHDNPKIITVDSPLLGCYDFTFDQVRYDTIRYTLSSLWASWWSHSNPLFI
jgi:hypothetical protein